jgi:hypothetical protein
MRRIAGLLRQWGRRPLTANGHFETKAADMDGMVAAMTESDPGPCLCGLCALSRPISVFQPFLFQRFRIFGSSGAIVTFAPMAGFEG